MTTTKTTNATTTLGRTNPRPASELATFLSTASCVRLRPSRERAFSESCHEVEQARKRHPELQCFISDSQPNQRGRADLKGSQEWFCGIRFSGVRSRPRKAVALPRLAAWRR
ncbi:unnamed protein product [Lampetra fluviatilis]